MPQRLPTALAQVKAGNTSENLLNEISQSYTFRIQKRKLLKKYATIQWIQQNYKTEWILYLWILKILK